MWKKISWFSRGGGGNYSEPRFREKQSNFFGGKNFFPCFHEGGGAIIRQFRVQTFWKLVFFLCTVTHTIFFAKSSILSKSQKQQKNTFWETPHIEVFLPKSICSFSSRNSNFLFFINTLVIPNFAPTNVFAKKEIEKHVFSLQPNTPPPTLFLVIFYFFQKNDISHFPCENENWFFYKMSFSHQWQCFCPTWVKKSFQRSMPHQKKDQGANFFRGAVKISFFCFLFFEENTMDDFMAAAFPGKLKKKSTFLIIF